MKKEDIDHLAIYVDTDMQKVFGDGYQCSQWVEPFLIQKWLENKGGWYTYFDKMFIIWDDFDKIQKLKEILDRRYNVLSKYEEKGGD